MKRLLELSEAEWNSLKSAGALYKLYRNAPQDYSGLTTSYARVQNPNTNNLLTLMEEYLNNTNPTQDFTYKTNIFKLLFRTFYGLSILDYLKQNK